MPGSEFTGPRTGLVREDGTASGTIAAFSPHSTACSYRTILPEKSLERESCGCVLLFSLCRWESKYLPEVPPPVCYTSPTMISRGRIHRNETYADFHSCEPRLCRTHSYGSHAPWLPYLQEYGLACPCTGDHSYFLSATASPCPEDSLSENSCSRLSVSRSTPSLFCSVLEPWRLARIFFSAL